MDLAMALAARGRRGPRGRQRPGRRPVRRRGPGPPRLADAARRRGRRAARPPPDRPRPHRRLRPVDRVLQPARQDGRRCRPAARGDPDRLQVDRPGPGPGLRLRGGAGLLRRPRPREGQGRRLGAAARLRAGRRGEGRGPWADRRPRRHRPRARPARHRPALGPLRRPRPDPGDDGPAARHAPDRRSAGSPSSGSRTSRRARPTLRRPTGCATRSPTGRG